MEGIRGKDAIIKNACAAIPATVGMPILTAPAPDHVATALILATVGMPILIAPAPDHVVTALTPATVGMPLITAAATLTLGICRAGRKR